MSRSLKGLMASFLIIISFIIVRSIAKAQLGFGFPPLWQFPSFSSQPLQVPTWEDPFAGEGDILIDNFEYWDSPYNHVWLQQEPVYPVYGFGMDYATIFNTVLDLQQGSRVLDVYRPASIFLLGTPKHSIFKDLFTPPSAADPDGETGIDMTENPIIGFEFKASPGIEPWDLDIIGTTVNGDDVIIKIVPIEPSPADCLGGLNATENMYGAKAVVTGFGPSGLEVTIAVGRSLLDDSWHAVWFDLVESVHAALEAFNGIDTADRDKWTIVTATAIKVSGGIFRMDNIIFGNKMSPEFMTKVDLFEMGPLYAQIFEPYRYLFIADYEVDEGDIKVTDLMLNPDNFLLMQDPNDPNDPVIRYWTDLGADPNLFGQNDPNIAKLFGRDRFVVDLSLAIFADQNLQITPAGPGSMAKKIIDSGTLGWNAIVIKYGPEPICINHLFDPAGPLQPFYIYPYDGMPTYLPAYYSAIEVVKKLGKPYYTPNLVSMLEGALWNAGVAIWPNIAHFDYYPQDLKDLLLTIEVTNGTQYDLGEIPISVVDYPVENYPPILQLPTEDLIFFVDEVGEYHINFIDPDCFIFSLSETPPSSHIPGFPVNENFRMDMDDLNWGITAVDGVSFLPSWSSYISDINIGMNDWDYGYFQCTGLLTLHPEYEKIFDMVVTCEDDRGAGGFAELKIIYASRSDTDGDNIYDFIDNCPNISNPDQKDTDQDDIGDACDPCPFDPNNDADADSFCTDEGDCEDHNATIYPAAPELCDGKDNDCDGAIPSDEVDSDSDGFLACNDCDDQDSTIYPDAPGTREGKDNNCNGVIDKNEKKHTSQSPFNPGYMPILFLWLQPFQYSNLNYQLPLTASWLPIQCSIYQQQPWYSGYQSPSYANPYMQSVFQYGQFQFPFSKPYWSQAYMMPWDFINNQLP